MVVAVTMSTASSATCSGSGDSCSSSVTLSLLSVDSDELSGSGGTPCNNSPNISVTGGTSGAVWKMHENNNYY